MNIFDLTLTQLRNIENKRPDMIKDKISSFVIVPLTKKHESGYSCMKFILLDSFNDIIGCVGGYSDVVYLNGIGGHGLHWNNSPKEIGWQIDCLPKSRCLRIWCDKELTIEDLIVSGFEIFVKEAEK